MQEEKEIHTEKDFSTPLVSIVIVYWNNAKYISRCIENLSLQTFQNFEVIIVDNGSDDYGVVSIEEKYPKLDLMIERLMYNTGFATANNVGARLARGQWLVLLNADAFPESNWLERLVATSELHPQFASFSSRQLKASNPRFLDGATQP